MIFENTNRNSIPGFLNTQEPIYFHRLSKIIKVSAGIVGLLIFVSINIAIRLYDSKISFKNIQFNKSSNFFTEQLRPLRSLLGDNTTIEDSHNPSFLPVDESNNTALVNPKNITLDVPSTLSDSDAEVMNMAKSRFYSSYIGNWSSDDSIPTFKRTYGKMLFSLKFAFGADLKPLGFYLEFRILDGAYIDRSMVARSVIPFNMSFIENNQTLVLEKNTHLLSAEIFWGKNDSCILYY
jgi:hypothetical protein